MLLQNFTEVGELLIVPDSVVKEKDTKRAMAGTELGDDILDHTSLMEEFNKTNEVVQPTIAYLAKTNDDELTLKYIKASRISKIAYKMAEEWLIQSTITPPGGEAVAEFVPEEEEEVEVEEAGPVVRLEPQAPAEPEAQPRSNTQLDLASLLTGLPTGKTPTRKSGDSTRLSTPSLSQTTHRQSNPSVTEKETSSSQLELAGLSTAKTPTRKSGDSGRLSTSEFRKTTHRQSNPSGTEELPPPSQLFLPTISAIPAPTRTSVNLTPAATGSYSSSPSEFRRTIQPQVKRESPLLELTGLPTGKRPTRKSEDQAPDFRQTIRGKSDSDPDTEPVPPNSAFNINGLFAQKKKH